MFSRKKRDAFSAQINDQTEALRVANKHLKEIHRELAGLGNKIGSAVHKGARR